MSVFRRIRAALKAAAMVFTGGHAWDRLFFGDTRFDFGRVAGDGRHNAIVAACLNWIMRAYPESPIQIMEIDRDGVEHEAGGHDLTRLITAPNPFYSGETLWQATVADYNADGNAYWIKIRNGYGEPVELWWVPSWMMEPRWDASGRTYISHYEYLPGGHGPQRIDIQDVVHFRFGLDPHNTRKGLAPLKKLLREIYTDDEAANFSAMVLHNLGVPGVVISPEDSDIAVTPEDADAIKADFADRFGGDQRGAPMVLSAPAKVQVVSWSPQQMALTALRRVPEERVSAVMGIPAIVAGLGAGLDRSTYSNMHEAREMAYESNIVPTQRVMAGALQSQLLPDFEADPDRFVVRFDLSQVRVLQEDQNALWERVSGGVKAGWLTVARAKEMVGETPDAADAVYLRPYSVTAVPEGAVSLQPEDLPKRLGGVRYRGGEVYHAEAIDVKGADARMVRFVREQQRLWSVLARPMAAELRAFFADTARRVTAALMDGEKALDDPENEWPHAAQDALNDDAAIRALMRALGISEAMRTLFEQHYGHVIEETWALVQEAYGVEGGVNLPDLIARDLIRHGGQRIVDIDEQTREAIAAALADGREAGEGAEALARRIAQYVDGSHLYPGIAEREGPEAAARYRAEVIARTETKIAQNLSAISSYEALDVVESLLVFDGDACGWTHHNDPDVANGKIVTFEEARDFPLAHPNCVRAFAPVVRE